MAGWRLRARHVIREVIAENPDLREDPEAMLRKIDDAYPFGMRKYTPYKEWLAERAKAMSELTTDPTWRPCPTCRARIGRPCRGIGRGGSPFHEARSPQMTLPGPLFDGVQKPS